MFGVVMLILRSLLSSNTNRYRCISFKSRSRWEWKSAGYMHYRWYSLYCFHCSFISNIIFNLNYSVHDLFILIYIFFFVVFIVVVAFFSLAFFIHLKSKRIVRSIGTATMTTRNHHNRKSNAKRIQADERKRINLNSSRFFAFCAADASFIPFFNRMEW